MSLILFYNLSGIIFTILALLMIGIRSLDEENGHHFNVAKRYMSLIFIVIGLSMFAAQYEEQIPFQKFEKINPLMLLCFYLAGQGILFSLLTLYSSRYASKPYIMKTMLPVIGLFSLYTIGYPFLGDIKIYTLDDFLNGLSSSPLLILRLVILPAMSVSLIYSMWLCHKAKVEYNEFLCKNFSEISFANGAWLNNLFWWVKALSIWCLLTYFYTTPILEIIVGILMIIVFSFYLKEFRSYRMRYALFNQIQTEDDTPSEASITEYDEKAIIALNEWTCKATKPYMRAGLTINDVVNETGIPKYRLSNYLNRTEDNFNTWINKLRIEEAALLLADSANETPLYLIAQQTGFSSLPVFSRTFKKVKGVTPSEYRNQYILQSLHQKINIIVK